MTKPSRPWSNGRLACAGIVVAGGHGPDDGEGPKAEGASGASAPPATMTSASPRAMARNASPMAMAPEAQLIPLVEFGTGEAELDGDVAAGGAGEDREGQSGINRARTSPHEVPVLTPLRGQRRRARCPWWRRSGPGLP